MAEGKKSFLLYCDVIHTVNKLTNEQAGKLFKHVLAYVNDVNPVCDDLIIEIAFEPIKQFLKRDLKKYEDIKEKRSKAGKASAESRSRKSTKRTHVNNSQQSSTDSTVIDIDIDIDNIYNTYPSKCPIKNNSTGKCSKDKEKIRKLLKEKTKDQLIDTINWYIKNCIETKTYIKNFSTFLNNLPDIPEIKQEIKPKQISKHDLYGGLNTEYAN